ncbi:MAG: protein translocase subunit SecD [Gemmatimonadetes bacterium]|nr:protein translocase subunit SecD [Gemmatimonadota bacterium]
MFDSLKARFLIIIALSALSVWTLASKGITLGLDLQGGTNLALEVRDPNNAMTAAQRTDAIDRALTIIRTRIDELGVAEPVIQKVGDDRIMVELPGATAEEQGRAKDVIQKTAALQFQIVRPVSELETAIPRIDRLVAERFRATVAPTAAAPAQGTPGTLGGLFENQRDSAAAGAATDSTAGRAFSSRLVPTGGVGEFAVATEDVPVMERYLASPEVQALLPRDLQLRWKTAPTGDEAQATPYRLVYLVEKKPLMTGDYLVDAQAQRDPQMGRPIVTFKLNRRGGRIFGQGTGEHIGDQMAIVLDDRVHSAPVINGQITTNGQIDLGNTGTIEEARDLALVLRAGALPVPLDIVEERSVGPSLGADSVQKGQLAGMIGLAAVILMVLLYYHLSGVLAVVGLALYGVYTLAMLSGVGAALTFPGIAGFVLSVGMAVDANVLIFERIREELAEGRNVRAAVNQGFKNALPAIIDSNLTTLITSLVLYQFGGTGPVRGFAVTLALGLIASFFTAVFVTRTFFMLYLERRPTAATISI